MTVAENRAVLDSPPLRKRAESATVSASKERKNNKRNWGNVQSWIDDCFYVQGNPEHQTTMELTPRGEAYDDACQRDEASNDDRYSSSWLEQHDTGCSWPRVA